MATTKFRSNCSSVSGPYILRFTTVSPIHFYCQTGYYRNINSGSTKKNVIIETFSQLPKSEKAITLKSSRLNQRGQGLLESEPIHSTFPVLHTSISASSFQKPSLFKVLTIQGGRVPFNQNITLEFLKCQGQVQMGYAFHSSSRLPVRLALRVVLCAESIGA